VVKLLKDFDHKRTKDWRVGAPRPGIDESRCDPDGYSLGQWQLDAPVAGDRAATRC
jgi:hypothetical protein